MFGKRQAGCEIFSGQIGPEKKVYIYLEFFFLEVYGETLKEKKGLYFLSSKNFVRSCNHSTVWSFRLGIGGQKSFGGFQSFSSVLYT